MLPAIIEQDLKNKDCFIVTNDEDSMTLTAGTNLKVVLILDFVHRQAYKDFFKKDSCLLYYEGMTCRWSIKAKENTDKCKNMHDNFNLTIFKSYNYEDIKYDLYYIKQKGTS